MREGGHAAVELALGIGLLLLPAALAILSFGPWSERRVLAEAIADESARAAVLALDVSAGSRVAQEMGSNHGLGANELELGWCGEIPGPSGAGACSFARGDTVVVSVRVMVALITTPWGSVGGLWAIADHEELVDLYRSLE